MASRRKKVAKAVPFSASDLQNLQKANPYVQRLIEDAELRDNLTTALDSGKSAYNRLLSAKAPQKAVLDDKKLHKDVSSAAQAARDAIGALGCCSCSWWPPARSSPPRGCAPRCSTRCSAPRRSSSTRRRPRRRRRPRAR
jgi:hypothetical protein